MLAPKPVETPTTTATRPTPADAVPATVPALAAPVDAAAPPLAPLALPDADEVEPPAPLEEALAEPLDEDACPALSAGVSDDSEDEVECETDSLEVSLFVFRDWISS